MQIKIHGWHFILAVLVVIGGCDQQPKVMSSSTGLMPQRAYDAQQLASGKQVFAEYCVP